MAKKQKEKVKTKDKDEDEYNDSYSSSYPSSSSTSSTSSSYSEDYSKYDAKISEAINFKTKNDGEILESSVKGSISVINNGKKDRIWDIDLELSGLDNTNLKEKKIHINELEPEEVWSQEYDVEIKADDTPPLKVIEIIDTFPDTEEESRIFMLNVDSDGQTTVFKIQLENTRDATVSDLILKKEIISEFRKIKIKSQGRGRANYDDTEGHIEWKIEKLGPQETTELEFEASVLPTEVKTLSSGGIQLAYKLESGTYSGLKIESIDGWSEELHYVDRDERDEEPDVWDCKLEFRNRSEFPLKLQSYKLVFGDENTEFDTITNEPNVIVRPGNVWTSEPWDIDSEDEPTFSESFTYTVEAEVVESLSMSATIEPVELYVLALEGTKELSETELKSYKETTVDAIIKVKTKGSAPIDVLKMDDTIPKDFKNPEKSEITFMVGKKKVPAESFSLKFDPDTDDIGTKRIMKVEVTDVLKNFGELKDGTSIQVKYPLTAVSPNKDVTYDAPVVFQAYIKPFPTPVETRMELTETITVIHTRRKTTIGKSVSPGSEKGLYKILIIYKNRGDATKTDVVVADFVPTGFEIVDHDRNYEEESKDDGTLLKWTIAEIVPGEEAEINYALKGKGKDYSLKNIEAKAFK